MIEAEVGVPKWICQGYPEPAADGDQRFITEEQIPDKPEDLRTRPPVVTIMMSQSSSTVLKTMSMVAGYT